MGQAEMIEKIASNARIKKAAAGRALKTMVSSVIDSLKTEGKASIAGIGVFKVRATKARQGRNPKTGQTIQIAASKRVLFKPSVGLKKSIKS